MGDGYKTRQTIIRDLTPGSSQHLSARTIGNCSAAIRIPSGPMSKVPLGNLEKYGFWRSSGQPRRIFIVSAR